MNLNNFKNNKFTLIELLVVVAIIGILVSLLLPSFKSARDSAKVTVCLSNQKNIAIAYNSYAAANNRWAVYHRWYNTHSGTKGTHNWANDPEDKRQLNKYLPGGPKVAWCPGDKGDSLGSKNHVGLLFGSSFVTTYTGGSPKMLKHSTNIAAPRNISAVQFKYPHAKHIMYAQVLRLDRDWNDLSGRNKWHDQFNPRYTLGFIDGHAVYYNFFWKKAGKVNYSETNNDDVNVRKYSLY